MPDSSTSYTDHDTNNENSRRDFLKQLALMGFFSGISTLLPSCSNAIEANGKSEDVFGVWEEMLQAIQQSPDYLPKRIENLIAGKDPEAMFNFVRDEINLVPPSASSLRGMGTAIRYGINGVLRDGFATPREKAELLNQMFQQAGITSKVVFERTDFKTEEVPSLFFRPVERKAEPAISETQYKNWEKVLNGNLPKQELSFVDENGKESKDLADKLWELLPEKEKIRYQNFDFRWDNYRTPAVSFEWNGETKYAHLFDPTVPFGQLRSSNQLAEAGEATFSGDKVQVKVTFREGIEPRKEHLLVEKDWPVEQLIGKQLQLSFFHGLNLKEQAQTNIGSLRTFTPALTYQSFEHTWEEMEQRSVFGNPITLEGRVIDVSGELPKIGNFSLLSNADPELVKKVQGLEVKAIPAAFPLVKLEVVAKDQNGELVEGLGAGDFQIQDNGRDVQALMEANRRTPRILVLYDTSLSMPKDYFGEKMAQFLENLEKSILDHYPAAQIQSWATDSNLYTWLMKASKTSHDLIIFATDGDNGDELQESYKAIFAAGPPAMVLNVYNSNERHRKVSFENMANLTGGTVLDAKDQEVTLGKILDHIQGMNISPYVFTYYAAGPLEVHEVKVSMDQKRLNESQEFQFSEIGSNESPVGQKIIGLYLTVKIGNQEVKRVLAGWDPVTESKAEPRQDHFEAVRNQMLGSILIGIEGEGPTYSAALSDLFQYRLSKKKWIDAINEKDVEKAISESHNQSFGFDPMLVHLLAPLNDAVTQKSLTFASGPRMVIFKRSMGVGKDSSTSSFDFLPTGKFVTMAEDTEEAFRVNMTKTAQMAVLEKSYYQESTLELLKDAQLISDTEAKDQDWFKARLREGEDAGFWYERIFRGNNTFKIFDRQMQTQAFWQIHQNTGELYGILPDMTGGGKDQVYTKYDDIHHVLQGYAEKLGEDEGAGINYAAYGIILMKLYAIAAHALETMDTTNMEEEVMLALQMRACHVAWFIHGGMVGRPQKIMGGVAQLISMMDRTDNGYPCS
ncbi:hypothetical protein [Fontibacter flavus]|uniref:VWA domain-containing protein n=1 Tax=Fontibacter flavus TaxID=654838 RepID=A0ABV6FX00_9BACT